MPRPSSTERDDPPPAPLEPGALYRVLAETAPDPIVTIDEGSIILSVNPAAERAFGYAADELVGRPLQMLMPERLRAAHTAGVSRYLATGKRHVSWHGLQLPILTRDGTELPVEISFGEFTSDGRRIFSGFLRDVSQRVESERALREAHDRLQEQAVELEATNEELQASAAALEEELERRASTDAALRESEERYRHLFDDSPFPIFVADVGTLRVLQANQAALTTYGYSLEELRAISIRDLRDPDTLTEFDAVLPRLRNGERIVRMETRHRTRDGRVLDVEVTTEHLAAEGPGVRMVVVNDVTARKRAEERTATLQRVTAALSRALTPADVASVVVERGTAALGAHAGVILALEHGDDAGRAPAAPGATGGLTLRLLRSIGYPQAMLDRWDTIDVDAPLPIAEAARTREAVFISSLEDWRERYPGSGPLRMLPDSRSWAAVPLVVHGEVVGVMGLSFTSPTSFPPEDRDYVLALAQQCAQALDRARLFAAEHAARLDAEAARLTAEEASQAKSQFLATMSHELRTPLNAIGGYTELLEMGIRGPVTESQREDLERIRRSQRHLLALITDLLNFAKLEAGRVDFELTDVPVAAALDDVEVLIAPQAEARGLAYRTSLPERELVVRADREKLQQVLVNLLTNAIKFTDPPGTITVRCATASRDGMPMVRIEVEDTGIGIPADRFEAIFDPFVQVDTRLTRIREGTGLGLAISRDLARGMGGELTVRSELAKGSTFTLLLPRADHAA